MQRDPRFRRPIRAIATLVAFAVLASGLGMIWSPAPAQAEVITCDPTDDECEELPDVPDVPIPFQAPTAELSYSLEARAGKWIGAWSSRDGAAKAWDRETYDPSYVHPQSFPATFTRQCVDEIDWNNEMNLGTNTANTYRWIVDGVAKDFRTCYSTKLDLKGQGLHDVKLQVRNAAGQVIKTKERAVLVKDHLVVLLGDSAASGEGSPEQNRTANQENGTWVDRRCHRSSHAAVPRAIQEMEAADPHTTITFLNFSCSGATLGRWIDGEGSGVLGKYVGIEHPTGVDPANVGTYLPAQVDQLDVALTRQFRNQVPGINPLRKVDKVFVSAGINDVKFSNLALVCVLYETCTNVTNAKYGSSNNVANVFNSYANAIPGDYAKLDQALDSRSIVTEERFVMQYPDAFSKTATETCSSMLDDVLPAGSVWFVVTLVLGLLPLLEILAPPVANIFHLALANLSWFVEYKTGITDVWGVLADALQGDLEWAPDEIAWMKNTAMPKLDNALKAGAVQGGFTYVGGIAPLFKAHGYCAADNWIVRATQSSYRQGPWDNISQPIGFYHDSAGWHVGGLNVHAQTKGLFHPSPAGHNAIKDQLIATQVQRNGRTEGLLEDLVNHAPIGVPNTYSLNLNDQAQLDTGWGWGLLANDIDIDGDDLRSTLAVSPLNGTATVDPDGRLIYKPKAGWTGVDTLYYRVTDGSKTSALTKVTVNVTKPVVSTFTWTVPVAPNLPTEDYANPSPAEFPICAGCGDMILKTATPLPAYGTVTFKPRVGFTGQQLLSYTATTNGPNLLVDSFDVVAGKMVDGVFVEMHRARVSVQILPYLR